MEADSILDWQMEVIGGVKRLAYLRLHEFNEYLEDTGTEQHLVLTLEPSLTIRRNHVTSTGDAQCVEVQVGDELLPAFGGGPIFYISAVIFGPNNLALDTEKPPLLVLVDVNIAHFENSANLEHALWLSAMPTPVVSGPFNEEQKPSAIGPATMWMLPEGSSVFYLSAPSDAHNSLRQALQDKEQRMAALCATMIPSGQCRNEAAATASMRYQNDTSVLLSSINMLEAGVSTLLAWASDWVQPGEVNVEFNRDRVSAQMDPTTITALLKSWTVGAILRHTFIDAMRRGEFITHSAQDEMDLIEEEGGDLGLPGAI